MNYKTTYYPEWNEAYIESGYSEEKVTSYRVDTYLDIKKKKGDMKIIGLSLSFRMVPKHVVEEFLTELSKGTYLYHKKQ